MTVYVDDMFPTKPVPRWPYKESCHMVADTREELEEMAIAIGLAHHWIQHEGEHNEHYDLTRNRREKAIELGAVPIPWRKMAELFERKKKEASRVGSVQG